MSVLILLISMFAFIYVRDCVRTHRKPSELLNQTLLQNPERWNEAKGQTDDWYVRDVSIRDRVFQGLDFENTEFHFTVFENVVMKDCNLYGVSFYRSQFKNVRIEGGNLSEMSVSHANWEDVVITEAGMGGFRTEDSEWNRVNLKRVNLTTSPHVPVFYDVVMRDVLIEESDLGTTIFTYIDAKGVTIKGTNLSRTGRRDSPSKKHEHRFIILNSECGPAFREYCEKKHANE
ncbi:pentapeptide repeat-containing protein [Leptonema illini]|uniref:pentapeptide repeat-containing protein n=1 Tax=Leptonema illini TaxID=183 RepID=UPI0015C3966C|nr:pentapeptide repeat-containing protein [Leptonema illini]